MLKRFGVPKHSQLKPDFSWLKEMETLRIISGLASKKALEGRGKSLKATSRRELEHGIQVEIVRREAGRGRRVAQMGWEKEAIKSYYYRK